MVRKPIENILTLKYNYLLLCFFMPVYRAACSVKYQTDTNDCYMQIYLFIYLKVPEMISSCLNYNLLQCFPIMLSQVFYNLSLFNTPHSTLQLINKPSWVYTKGSSGKGKKKKKKKRNRCHTDAYINGQMYFAWLKTVAAAGISFFLSI